MGLLLAAIAASLKASLSVGCKGFVSIRCIQVKGMITHVGMAGASDVLRASTVLDSKDTLSNHLTGVGT
jgi:hypothetical protein